MCTPAFPWEWFTLDTAYVITLLAGALVLRTQPRSPFTWLLFGLLAAAAGAFCIVGTQMALGAFGSSTVAAASSGATGALAC